MIPRSVLRALAGVLLLAACADDESSGAGDRPAVTAPPPTTPAPTTSTAPAGTGDGATTAQASPATATTTPTTAAAPDLGAVRVRLTPIVAIESAIALASRPGGDSSLHVADQDGRVWAVAAGGGEPRQVLDLTDRTEASGERGLLGIAFSPDGNQLYASYTDEGDGASVLDEYRVADDGSVDAGSRRELLREPQPFRNHNGGHVTFGPDGHLYLGLGDGGSAGDPQRNGLDLSTPLGKLLRIDPRPTGDRPYAVPTDNPFVAVPGARPEIWSFGLRNPWRFSFDAATGDLWVADVGQSELEEVDVVPAAEGAGRGTNFGWSAFEGTARFNDDQPVEGARPPVYEYSHGDRGCSVTGGFVYRGGAIPALRGAYVYSDYCAGGIRALVIGPAGVSESALLEDPDDVVSFGEGPDRELFVLSTSQGVFRLDPG